MKEEKKELALPDEITYASNPNPRDLVIIGIPKIGKGTIIGSLTKEKNAIVFDLERGGYEYIDARKVSIYDTDSTSFEEAFKNYVKLRNLLLGSKGKYEFLAIDGLSDLDMLAEYGGTRLYMDSIIGKKFNREVDKATNRILGIYEYTSPEWKSVLTLPDGAGYMWTRKWFLEQVEIFRQISPYRLYAAHISDKLVKDNGREEVVGSEIALTGKLKSIFAAKVTSLAKLVAEDNKRYLNFDVLNDSILAGSRNPKLSGKILISEKEKDGTVKTFWSNIYS